MIKMAKPIEYIEENEKNEMDITDMLPEEYKESFSNLLKTVKNLNDSGFFSLINALTSNYKYIIDTLSDQLESEDTKRSMTNIFSIFQLLSKLDTDKTVNYMSELGNAISNAKIPDRRYGLMDIARTINNNDTARTIILLLKILSDTFGKK
ncbi:hypothetical protein SE19_08270 [Acidiplasma aeolicum]|uniref:DUF1641 domain-containing protein n=4 Tax=Ferroplasmaceae TaxID=90142 RepID=A0A0Q0XJI2_9ARCH|nr:hypothetical protein TZ01_02770 [Acidiplasma sp. MBA-1]KPV45773.1 hypothetical protein SE19_08270 [Acidiplasma aeolicum]KQB34667.1 hypothetical protein AOG54_04145 [Acidiplasma aeolicum]KQB35071.1 hypothetical protein AOG55_07975 [Acidiplasma cupricumulans]